MLIFDNYNGVQFIPNINFVFSLSIIKVSVGTVTENLPFERFRFLKLSEFKQWKSFVRIGQNFKDKMA